MEHPDSKNLPGKLRRLIGTIETEDDLRDRTCLIKDMGDYVDATPRDDSDRLFVLAYLCELMEFVYRKTINNDTLGNLSALVNWNKERVRSTPKDDPIDYVVALVRLGQLLNERFDKSENPRDLDEAIDAVKEAVTLSLDDNLDLRPRLGYRDNPIVVALVLLGQLLKERFDKSGNPRDLDEAIDAVKEAVTLSLNDILDLRSRLVYGDNPIVVARVLLGQLLRERFYKSRKPCDLDEAIDAFEEAITLSLDDQPDNLDLRCVLGDLLRIRSSRNSSKVDVERAIQIIEKAIETSLENHGDPGAFLNSYGMALQCRYKLTNSLSDLDNAVKAHEEAVEHTSKDHRDRGGRLSNLSNALSQHLDRTQSTADKLDRAIAISAEAVESTPANHYDLPGRLNNLSNAYFSRFERAGLLADLNKCVTLNRKAVNLAKGGHQDRAECLLILGLNLQHLSQRLGSTEDLEDAIGKLEEAVPLLQEGDSKMAICLSGLGNALVARFHKKHDMDDLDEGIKLQKKALDSTPKGHRHRVSYMTKVGNSLATRFRKGNVMNDLNASVKYHEDSVRETIEDSPSHAICLTNHGNALVLRFDTMHRMEDLDMAFKTHEEALKLIPSNHQHVAVCEDNLGKMFAKRFEMNRIAADRNAAIECFERAFAIPSARPSMRIGAARDAARLRLRRRSEESNDIERAARLLKEAVELLPMTSPLSLKRSDQQDELSGFAGLASSAAALSLYSGGTAFEALQLLELGRGVMASLQLDARTDITSLTDVRPELAAEFEGLRNTLDSPQSYETSFIPSGIAPGNAVTSPDRHTIVENFNDVVNRIRNEGFPNFLRGPTADEITTLANEGPVIVFNIDIDRSDVFLVTSKGIDTLALPKLQYEEVKAMARSSRGIIEGRAATMRKARVLWDNNKADTMDAILKWLWDAAVCPILTKLESSALLDVNKDDLLPRVWWITSGWLSLLPIHAAGCHSEGSTENALDRVISSYAPTLKSLRYARDKEKKVVDDTCEHALLVSMQNTEEQNCLPGADEEIDSLDCTIPSSIKRTILRGAAKDAVMRLLGDCHICHFACHGESHPADPSRSRLLLADWKSNPLSVNDIVGLRPKNAKLAYLSACSAADSKVEALLDESINLMSAFLLAGFPCIVGTLWQIRDLVSVEVATHFYRSVCEGRQSIKVRGSAAALNSAIRQIRSHLQFGDSSCIWAPYIHIGV